MKQDRNAFLCLFVSGPGVHSSHARRGGTRWCENPQQKFYHFQVTAPPAHSTTEVPARRYTQGTHVCVCVCVCVCVSEWQGALMHVLCVCVDSLSKCVRCCVRWTSIWVVVEKERGERCAHCLCRLSTMSSSYCVCVLTVCVVRVWGWP